MLYLSRWAFAISSFLVFFTAGYLTCQQYLIWSASPFARLLLPPTTSIAYFIQYALTNFWTAPLIAMSAALLGLVATTIMNRRFQNRFFWPGEPWIFATALLLVGHPGWLLYVPLLLLVFLAWQIFFAVFHKNHKERASLYYLWVSGAIVTVILGTWFKFPFSS